MSPDDDALAETQSADGRDDSNALAETQSADARVDSNALSETAADSLAMRRSIPEATKIGRFVVIGQLGQGGMGVVVVAFDPQLDRKVAIKMLHGNVSAAQGVRLEREAKAMAQLNHPNVVSIYETGTFEDALYIAMEYVDGQTFGQWLRAKPRTNDEIFDVLLQAGRGLAAAHAADLVHRDFKPDNILVGKDGRTRVSDFGLVSSALESQDMSTVKIRKPATASQLTLTGSVMGTPLYMAPEQHDGRTADAKADQFSFCVTLWQALCNEMPYGADTYDDLVKNVTGGKLRPVPRTAHVPAKIRAILARGLSSNADERFPSIQALLVALERARRRSRWPLLAGGAVALVGASVGIAFAMRGGSAPVDPCATAGDQRVWSGERGKALNATLDKTVDKLDVGGSIDRYVARWSEQRRAACRATQSPELLDLRMHCYDDRLAELEATLARFSDVTTRDAVFRAADAARSLPGFADCDDTARLRAAVPLPADPLVRARIADLEKRTAEAISLDKFGEWKKAFPLVEALEREARAVNYAPLIAKLTLLRAGMQWHDGKLALSEASYREAAEAAATARDDERIAQAWSDLVGVYASEGKFTEALGLVTIARTATERVSDRPLLGARFSNALGGIYLAQQKYPDAKREYEHALDLARKDGGKNEILGAALTNMGMILWYVGDPAGAVKHFEEGRAWFTDRYGPMHPSLGYVHRNLGDLDAQKADLEAALGHYRQALEIFEAAHGPDHIDVAIALDPMIYAYAHTGKIDKARAAGDRALAIREKTLGPTNVQIATPLVNLSDADLVEGTPAAYKRARDRLNRALALQTAAFGADGPALVATLDRVANVHELLGDHQSAFTALERSLAIQLKATGDHSNEAALSHVRIADVELAMGKFALAIADFERAETIFTANDPTDLDIARAKFGRARATWFAGKHTEAIVLAKTARATLAAATDLRAAQPTIDAIDGWLAEHR